MLQLEEQLRWAGAGSGVGSWCGEGLRRAWYSRLRTQDFRGQQEVTNILSRGLVSSELRFRKISQAMAVRMDLRNAELEVSCLPQTLLAGEAGSQGVRI